MRFSLVALAAFAAVASAQIPTCATECLATADLDGCSATDNACLCKSDKFVTSTYNCITQKCTGNDLLTAVNAARELCRASGVTLTQTLDASLTATSPAASSTSAPTATATPASNAAVTFNGAAPMAGALAAMAGVVFAL